ncbi:MAG: AAA family ATPase [Chloroflexota bacterium]|nr:AAA family ATPase [Chloroflexota bacterium]
MSNGSNPTPNPDPPANPGITQITVGGYKSIRDEQSIAIRPLTLLAGANSSGKSSMMQPLLLLKQTLEAPYDPGPLLLNGPNVRLTSVEQMLWPKGSEFHVGVEVDAAESFVTQFFKPKASSIQVQETDYKITHRHFLPERQREDHYNLRLNMNRSQILEAMPQLLDTLGSEFYVDWSIIRYRCFLKLTGSVKWAHNQAVADRSSIEDLFETSVFTDPIVSIIHLPGLRGSPERIYPLTAVGDTFSGTFDPYSASIILKWQDDKDKAQLDKLTEQLRTLGLTGRVAAKRLNDAQVEIQVGRTVGSAARDMVSIADVGLGVSQTLPVLVALLVAEPGQLVYLEQPEIHLHPRAQVALAGALAEAARRGVRVVAETHSALLLRGVQTLVAEGTLDPALVALHWFARGKDGATTVTTGDLDAAGAFGDWPEDFSTVNLSSNSRYLDAAETRLLAQADGK